MTSYFGVLLCPTWGFWITLWECLSPLIGRAALGTRQARSPRQLVGKSLAERQSQRRKAHCGKPAYNGDLPKEQWRLLCECMFGAPDDSNLFRSIKLPKGRRKIGFLNYRGAGLAEGIWCVRGSWQLLRWVSRGRCLERTLSFLVSIWTMMTLD